MVKVSVITTLYNYKRFIEDNINSFLDQNFNESELIIVDDYSTDNPEDVISRYTCKYKNIHYIRTDKNRGYSFAKNIGIEKSIGDLVVMLDADDMLSKNSLKIRYEKIQEGYDLVHGPASDYKDGKYSTSGLWNKWLKSEKNNLCYKFVHAQTVMLKKQIHREVGLYDEELRFKSDREMWARIFNHGYKIGYVMSPVSIYRIHDKQMHKSKEKMKINDWLEKEVQNKIEKRKTDLSGIRILK